MGRSIGVLATRYLWAGIVDGAQLGDVKVFPDPAQPQIDLKTVPAGDIIQIHPGTDPRRWRRAGRWNRWGRVFPA